MSFKRRQDEYDSTFEEDLFIPKRVPSRKDINKHGVKYKDPLLQPCFASTHPSGIPSRSSLNDLSCVSIGQALRYHQSSLTAYDRHKMLVNEYLLYHPGASKLVQRDSSRDVRDMDVVREHHQFLWSAEDTADTWQKQLAKKYYDKLFKEYCICDLSRYKENKVGMRWRTEREVQEGKGQFSCGEKRCNVAEGLTSWEMNFAYMEQEIKKNALVKLRLCEPCSFKVNYCHKRRKATSKHVKRSSNVKQKTASNEDRVEVESTSAGPSTEEMPDPKQPNAKQTSEDIWKAPFHMSDDKTRDDEFEEYLGELLL